MRKTAKHDDLLSEIEKLSRCYAGAQETADGWMQAYYRQTSRLLRAESALRDVIDGLSTQKGFEKTIAAINETLEELKDDHTDHRD